MAQRQLVHACGTLRVVYPALFDPCVPVNNNTASLSRVVPMSKWIRPWKPIWIPHGGNFQKAYVEEWEQEVYSHEYSCPSFHQTHDSRDESESNHGSYSASKTSESEGLQGIQGRRLERLM